MSDRPLQLLPDAPYPGLRAFTRDEARLFFGREEHTDELLEKLNHHRFLAVVGPSGCGKSSLIRAGLMASLEGGLMSGVGGRWLMAEMRPGNRPISALAKALLEVDLLRTHLLCTNESFDESPPTRGESEALLRANLRSGPLGLCKVLQEAPLPDRTNFLLLVDQFEELFAARREGFETETEAFVAMLLTSINFSDLPLYVVITMRSDYLGDCPVFAGLPEAINQSQFLTPRLSRDEREMAILGPAKLYGTPIKPELVNHLLNKAGPSPDQLPLLQHLLMRMWTLASREVHEGAREKLEIGFDDYNAAGGFECALSKHAGEAYDDLPDSRKRVAEILFRSICERDQDNREKRRLVSVETIAGLAGVSPEEVALVANVFRRPDRSFLMPPIEHEIAPDTALDVSHEALIRNWDTLKRWVAAESESAEMYRFLEKTARRWELSEAALWSTPDLEFGLAWKERERPTEEWAARYGGKFKLAMEFLDRSEKNNVERVRRREERRAADEQRLRELAQQQSLRAEAEHLRAEAERQRAEEERRRAEAERERAQTQEELVQTVRKHASEEADRRRRLLRRRLLMAALLILGLGAAAIIRTKYELAKLNERNQYAKDRAKVHLGKAQSKLASDAPKAKLLALTYLSLALRLDPGNVEAANAAADLLISKRWCPPLTPSFRCGSSQILAACFSPDGKQIFAISQNGSFWRWKSEGASEPIIRFWTGAGFSHDPAAAAPAPITLPGGDKVVFNGASFSLDGQQLVVTLVPPRSDDQVKPAPPNPGGSFRPRSKASLLTWDAASESYSRAGEPFETQDVFRTITWRKDRKMFATNPRGWDGGCEVFAVEANGCKLIQSTFNEHKVSLAEFQAEGTWLASASNEGTIELWDAGTLEPPSGMSGFKTQFKPPGASRPFSLVFGPKDDEVSVVCFNEPLRIWNLKSGEVREIPHIHNDQVMRYALTENRDRAAVSYNGRVVLATTPDLAQAAQPICPQGTIAFPLFSRDGEKLLTLSGAVWNSMDSVQVWRTEAPGPLPTVDKPFVGHPAPFWLADLAEAVGAQRIVSDEELSPPLILESLDNKYSEDDVEGPYEEVWRCFFPSGKQLSR